MAAANYRWVCFSCGASNPPEAERCVKCSFPARATGAEIRAAQEKAQPPSQPARPAAPELAASTVALFFPEALIAAVVLVSSPVLLFRLLAAGRIIDGLFFALAVIVAVALLFVSYRRQSKGVAYAAVIVLVIAGCATFTV
jgi:hypothetical protein